MGKYFVDEDKVVSHSELYLAFIANELAEQNRIARAEMDFKIMMAVDPAQVETFDFKNEDLA